MMVDVFSRFDFGIICLSQNATGASHRPNEDYGRPQAHDYLFHNLFFSGLVNARRTKKVPKPAHAADAPNTATRQASIKPMPRCCADCADALASAVRTSQKHL